MLAYMSTQRIQKQLTGLHDEACFVQFEPGFRVQENAEGLSPPDHQTLVSIKIRVVVAVVALYVQITALHV